MEYFKIANTGISKIAVFIFLLCGFVSLLIINETYPISSLVAMYVEKINVHNIWLTLTIIFALLVVELKAKGWEESAIKKIIFFKQEIRNDVFLVLLNLLGFTHIVIFFMTFGGTIYIPKYLGDFFGVTLLGNVSNQLAQLLIFLIVIDFISYWNHRLLHKIRFLWECHKFHHSMTEFVIFSRVHPFESLFRFLSGAVPLALLGAPIETFILVIVLRKVIGYLHHSMLEWDYGWVGRWVIYSPVHHRIHHSPHKEHWDKNFGNTFVVWDRIFGTWYEGELVNTTVGVSDNPYNRHNLVWDLTASSIFSFKRFYRSVRTGKWTS